MIIVEGWVRLAPGEVEKFRPAAAKMVEETRREPGCFEYVFAQDLGDPDLVRVVERWKEEASLTAHFSTPHMAAFNAALASAKIVGATIDAYSAEFTRTIMRV